MHTQPHRPDPVRRAALIAGALSSAGLLSPADGLAQDEVLEVTRNTTLDPARTYGRIVVKSSSVTIDGRGAWLVGSQKGDPKTFKGVAISAKNVSKVTLKNVNSKGWETGLRVENGTEWTVENCNFSDNFHDPAFGWGENGVRGGIVLERVHRSTLRKCKANNVWDACALFGSNDNTLVDNDFSHTSNTCLKLWNACGNVVRKNNLSYGIRIKQGEVHARDSACVLIESGSNDNRFEGNDCTHGGDGIFIRVLNGWVSTGNRFEGNDCSHANNNCVEAWAPRNTYVRNKANHGSYGFWLGASDRTVLLDNEASYNGDPKGIHNSPHLPGNGHAGIVFMFGPSSHTVVRGNTCVGNNGAGIALVGDIPTKGKKWKAFHWVIEGNTLESNRWGVYAQHADWIDLAANKYKNNKEGNLRNDGNVTNLTEHPENPKVTSHPRAVLQGPSSARVGQKVTLDASASNDPDGHPLRYRWDLGDGTTSAAARVEHVFKTPGFYRVGLTVNNGLFSDLAWRDFYAVEEAPELGTEGQASAWAWADPGSKVHFSDDGEVKIAGAASLHALVKPYSGGRLNLLYPTSKKAGLSLEGKKSLVFWFKAINEHVPAWQDANPIVTLHESQDKFIRLTPKGDLLGSPPYNEAREGWTYFAVPLAGDRQWRRSGAGASVLNYLTVGVDSWGAPPLRLWIDGMAVK